MVADNGSSDGSLDLLSESFHQVQTIALKRNFGFTGGHNRAIAQILSSSRPEYIVLLNSDILARKGWLEPLLEHLDSHPSCGVCGPKLHALECVDGQYVRSEDFEYAGAAGGWLDRYGFPFCSGRVLGRREKDCAQYDRGRKVLWVSGACLATRASLWEELSGLDERFFAHMEEIDYCLRAQGLGFSTEIVPGSTLWHLGGATLPASSPLKLKLNFRNSLLMLEKSCPGLLRRRIWIDRLALAAYWLSGQWDKARAVLQAHREFKRLRGGSGAEKSSKGFGRLPYGMLPLSIIVQAALRGEKVFAYVEKKISQYEDSH